MPNIRRKNGKFQARLTVKGKSLTATFPTREAADAWCLATRQELQAPRTWQLGNAAINRLLWTPDGLTLVGWADEQHLDSALDESSA